MNEFGSDVLPPRPKTAKEKAAALSALTEAEKRKVRCCFTGHRPQKLQRPVDDIKVDLENEILAAITDGYTTFITGMAYGTDIWAGSIVVRLKDRYPDIKLIAAIPFPEFSNNWDEEWKKKYDRLLASADLVKVICPEYHDGVYQLRNQWMVNHCSRLIGIYNGQPGGTRNTINYARSAKLTVKCLRG